MLAPRPDPPRCFSEEDYIMKLGNNVLFISLLVAMDTLKLQHFSLGH